MAGYGADDGPEDPVCERCLRWDCEDDECQPFDDGQERAEALADALAAEEKWHD